MLRHAFRTASLLPQVRCLSAAAPAASTAPVNKDALMKLRKRTGYSYVNCRKALVQFGPDKLEEAEKWLKELANKEGWAKAAKLSSRSTSQGLVGVMSSGTTAAIVELSCETDFVARGENFQQLLEELTSSVLAHAQTHATKPTSDKIATTSFDVDQISTTGGRPLRECLALAVGKLGENIGVKRADGLVAPSGATLHSSAHPKAGTDKVSMGKFVAVIALRRPQVQGLFPTEKLADQLCQHIIGMRSETLGEAPAPKKEEVVEKAPSAAEDTADELNDFFQGGTTSVDEDETALLRQAFMLNPSQTIHDYVQGHQTTIVDFARGQLGDVADE